MITSNAKSWRYGSLLAIALVAFGLLSPVATAETPKGNDALPITERYQFFRWMEDYSDVSEAQREHSLLGKLKHISITDDRAYPYLSLGGEYRFRLETSSNQFFGIPSRESANVYLHRFLVHGDVQLTENVRSFVQLGMYNESGRVDGTSPVNESEVDVQQAFMDVELGVFEARLGRQELFLDSAKQLGIREGPNQRRSFDALRIQYRPDTELGVDVFVGREVQPKNKAFEDRSSEGAEVWGVYGAKLFKNETNYLDAFYIDLNRSNATYNQGSGAEDRHTFGLRWIGQRDTWRYSYETYYQTGDFDGADMRAWALVTENFVRLSPNAWRPMLGIRANIASGDDDPNDSELGTFDALFPDLNYLTEAGVYTPRNLYELQVIMNVFPSDEFKIRLRSNFLWRQSTDDAVYVSPGFPLVAGDASDDRFIGYVLDVAATWVPTPNVSVGASYAFTASGDVIDDVGGRDTHYLTASVAFRF